MDENFRYKLFSVIKFCFFDVADNDYLSARILFRNELIQQAYWFSQQSVEKYLKTILLYNENSILKIGHNLELALNLVDHLPNLKVELPDDVREGIIELNRQGTNRYYEYPYSFSNITYFNLDKIVWHLRRYCIPNNIIIPVGDTKVNYQDFMIKIAHNEKYKKKPSKYKLSSLGVLEKILDDKKSIKRKHLVWKNQFYGETQKSKIKNVKYIQSFGNPPHFMDSSDFEELSKYIPFSKEVLKYFGKPK